MIRYRILIAALLALPAVANASCGPSLQPCDLDGGAYHASVPDSESSLPVVIFLHGAGSNGTNVFRNKRLLNDLTGRGYAVLAPTGSRHFGNGTGRVWNFFPGAEGRDELQYLKRVLSDASLRFPLNSQRVLLAGFSAGGFMINYLACQAPDTFAAYAPVSGGFWRPHPQSCHGPVKLFHTHGWSDNTVPIEGRYLRNGQYQQGDIFAGLEIWRAANRCTDEKPSGHSQTGQFWRRTWSDCAEGSALEFALFPGGHTVPHGWVDMVLDWFEAVAEQ